MSSSDHRSKKLFPKTELQGPRPPPLKVSRDSCKIKKHHPPLGVASHRPPVIIYTRSPEVIHAKPHDFMHLVQRLTGSSSSTYSASSSATSSAINLDFNSATVETGKSHQIDNLFDPYEVQELDTTAGSDQMAHARGVLSPVPSELSPIPPSFFLPPPNPFLSPYDFNSILYTPNYQDTMCISPRFNL